MKIRTRIILGFFIIYTLGFYFLGDLIVSDIRPRYLETVEESLNDTANILASLLETELKKGKLSTDAIKNIFSNVYKRKFFAKIFGLEKTGIGLKVYVTDSKGIVVYDSNNGQNEGKNFSKWNDVYLTLQGRYGARSTRLNKDDPASSLLHVAAPVKYMGSIVGVVTIVKPQDSVTIFIELARNKLIITGIVSCAVFIVLSILLSMWINSPVTKLTRYVKNLKSNKRAQFPKLGGSEIKNLGMAFQNLMEELEGKKYIEEYIQTLTHELKSPLSSIRGSAELLQEDMEHEQMVKFCGNILTETRRIDSIIEKLLLLSSIESRKKLEDIEEVNIHDLVSDVVESFISQIEKKNLKINMDIDVSQKIRCEKFLLRQSLANLLQNSIQFSGSGGRITFSSETDEKNLTIKIIDNGEGIPGFALEKIFNKFYSLPGKNTGKKSTGLGLPFVREVASLHGGHADVKNNDTTGVTASITLPL